MFLWLKLVKFGYFLKKWSQYCFGTKFLSQKIYKNIIKLREEEVKYIEELYKHFLNGLD